jgi:hypothetical protein
MSLTIEEMDLQPNARRAAELVQAAHPWVQWTSGRRGVYGQARAMAANVVKYGPGWLGDTYKDKRMVELLTSYCHDNPGHMVSIKQLASGFFQHLMEHYSGDIQRFPHIMGDAFDAAHPMVKQGDLWVIDQPKSAELCRTIETLPKELGLQLLLTKEGKHDVIHAQFTHLAHSVEV